MRQYLTIPNALTALRGLGVPLFIWLALDLHADGWAILVLAIGGVTDYLDGKLARMWNQTSRFGELADPAIDRIYLGSILIAFAIKGVLPIWLVSVLIGRDVILGFISLVRKRIVSVTYLGKAATFNLLYALPFLLLERFYWFRVLGWSFAIWGIGLYLLTGFSYTLKLLRQ